MLKKDMFLKHPEVPHSGTIASNLQIDYWIRGKNALKSRNLDTKLYAMNQGFVKFLDKSV